MSVCPALVTNKSGRFLYAFRICRFVSGEIGVALLVALLEVIGVGSEEMAG